MDTHDKPEDISIQSSKRKYARLSAVLKWIKHHKWWAIAGGIVLLLVVIALIPLTRYFVTSPFISKDVTVQVNDSRTQKPVSSATVRIAGVSAETDKDGKAVLAGIPVGFQKMVVEKRHYETVEETTEVPLFSSPQTVQVEFLATGRQTTVKVVNRLTDEAIENAEIRIGDDSIGKTASNGFAEVVVSADDTKTEVVVHADSYNDTAYTIEQDQSSTVQLIPEGRVYFLSKLTGTIDVVSTNLDGSDRQTVVQGTGNENDQTIALFASRDWRYLALKSKRSEAFEQLFIIDTKDNSITAVDGAASFEFNLVGWSDHNFIYNGYRSDRESYEAGAQVLKAYNADAKKITTLDETEAGGAFTTSQSLFGFYILKTQQIVYIKQWYASYYGSNEGRTTSIASIQADGTGKKALKSYSASEISYIETKLYTPQEIHYRVFNTDNTRRENLMTINGVLELVPPAQQKFDQAYPTYLISPDGKRSFWSESRDGLNALFIGDDDAKDSEQLANGSEFIAYGWYTDNYILMQKNGSELYISSIEQLKRGGEPLKISQYHKARFDSSGYGYGYGGQ